MMAIELGYTASFLLGYTAVLVVVTRLEMLHKEGHHAAAVSTLVSFLIVLGFMLHLDKVDKLKNITPVTNVSITTK